MVRLQILSDDLIRQIDTVLRDSRQINTVASVQYPGQSNVPQQQQIPGVSSACSIGGPATPDMSLFHYREGYSDKSN